MSNLIFGSFFVFMGLYCLAGSILNWNWYSSNRKSRNILELFGRTGARIFYGLFGTALVLTGIFQLLTPASGAN
jgi:predicted transporter